MADSPPSKLAPNSPEAESAVLGSILINPDAYLEVAAFLKPSDFFIVRNAWVYEAFEKLSEAHQAIDNLTVIEVLRNTTEGIGSNRLELMGGSAHITELVNNASDHNHIETYAHLVEKAAIRRRLLAAASSIAQCALEENSAIEAVIEKAETTLFGVTQRTEQSTIEPVGKIASQYYDVVSDLYTKKTALKGVTTGFDELDRLLSGLQKGRLYVIGAVSGAGKTSFALHLAMNGAKKAGVKSLFISLEMEREELINRLVGSCMCLDTQKLELGDLTAEQWGKFTDGLADVQKWPIFIDDSADLNITQLRSKIRRMIHSEGIQAVYVDYIQLMNAPRRDNREQQISYLSRCLKLMAKEFHIPVIVCAQLNRDLEKREHKQPQLSDLRESGAIAQNADVVLFLYRDDMYHENTERPNQCDVIIGKNRNGPRGMISLYFRKEYVQFVVMEKNKLNLADTFGPYTPQHHPAPLPKRAPVHIPDSDDHEDEDAAK